MAPRNLPVPRLLAALMITTILVVGLVARSLPPNLPIGARSTALLATPKPLPAVSLLRADTGAPFELSNFHNRWTLLYSGYLNCPDLCPTTLAGFAELIRAVSSQPTLPPAHSLQLAFVSIDYLRDSPAALASYTAHFHPSIVPLTGEPQRLQTLTRALGFINPPSTLTAQVGHSSAIALINPDAELHALFRYPHNFARIRALLTTLPMPAEAS